MENRALLHKIDYQKGTINLEGKEYKLLDTNFPTIDPKNPYKLTSEEEEIMDRLVHAFVGCENCRNICVSFLRKVVCIRYITIICCIMDVYR